MTSTARVVLSLNETRALARKAARGSGFSWGEADEIGDAVSALARAGYSCLDRLLAVLKARGDLAAPRLSRETSALVASDGRTLCPLRTGLALADCATLLPGEGRVVDARIAEPVLVLPFLLARASLQGAPLGIRLGDALVGILPSGGIEGAERCPAVADGIELTHAADSPLASPLQKLRVSVASDVLTALEALALATCAPPSDASRLAGAGAGLSDND